MKAGKVKGVLYVRVSSQEQADEGYSLDAQEKEGERYAERHRIEIVKRWVVSESAKAEGRKAFSELLSFAKSHPEVKIILVEKSDRLTRNLEDLVQVKNLVSKHDKEIHFFKRDLVIHKDSKSYEMFQLSVDSVISALYIDTLGEEVRKGMNEKAERGEFPQRPPLGYKNNKVTKLIEIDPDYALLIRRMFKLYATGEYSINQLKVKMKQEGLVYKGSGKSPPKSVFASMLNNPIYYGFFRWHGEVCRGIHEPIIDKDLFDKVQAVLGMKTRYKPLKKEFLFTGLITCVHCGCAITAELHKGKYVYYHCTGNRGGDCMKNYVREELIDQQFQSLLKDIRFSEEQLTWLKDCLKENHELEQEFKRRSITSLRQQQSVIERKLDRMYEDKLEGLISKEMWLSKSREYRDQLETISIKIQAHEKANLNYYDSTVRLLELAQKAHSLYLRASTSEKKKLLKFVCSNSQLDGKNLLVTYRKPFDLIAEGLSVHLSSPGQTRTADRVVNSHLLYQLSYRGRSSLHLLPSLIIQAITPLGNRCI